jgi:hypothetical protein
MPTKYSWPPKTLTLPAEEWSFKILEYEQKGEEYRGPDGFMAFYPMLQIVRIKVTPTRPDLRYLLSCDRLRNYFLEVEEMVFAIQHVIFYETYGIASCNRPLVT